MRKLIFGASVAVLSVPMFALAASTTTSVQSQVTNTGSGYNLAATSAGGAAQATAAGPFGQTAAIGQGSAVQATIGANGQYKASGGTASFSSINGHVVTQTSTFSVP
jgi:hypothetical protein